MTLAPKCDCGHGLVRHPTRGACTRCACTWYHPNVSAIKRSAKPMAKRGAAKDRREKKYKAYLSSAAWKRKRAACVAAAGGRCEFTYPAAVDASGRWLVEYGTKRCPNHDYLTAHHLTYARWKNELPEDLQCLCRSCHNRLEALKGRRVG